MTTRRLNKKELAHQEQIIIKHRAELAALFEKETGFDATLYKRDSQGDEEDDNYEEWEYDNPEFVNWLILRYVAAVKV